MIVVCTNFSFFHHHFCCILRILVHSFSLLYSMVPMLLLLLLFRSLHADSWAFITLQDEAVSAKSAFLAKSGREKRNLERQKARLLTKEEMDRLQELENKRLVRTLFHTTPTNTLFCDHVHALHRQINAD